MTDHQQRAADVRSLLNLDVAPVALTFASEPPAGVPQTTHTSPSTCGFWRHAEKSTFYATAEQHHNCQIGAMVMGFELPPEIMDQIGGLVGTMCGHSYLSPEEGDKIPSVGGGAHGILYGPLAEFPADPDLVLLWLTPSQAMIYYEAIGAASWAAEPTRIGGRPACAALPMALQSSRPTLSFGCMGMRTFTEISDDRMLAVVPGGKLGQFVDALRVTASANQTMESYYQGRKADVAGGQAAS